jgi:hypothetical protein
VLNNPHLIYSWFLRCRKSRSSDFSYKHDARHNSTLVVAKIHTEDSDDVILKMLFDVISMTKAGMLFVCDLNACTDELPRQSLEQRQYIHFAQYYTVLVRMVFLPGFIPLFSGLCKILEEIL